LELATVNYCSRSTRRTKGHDAKSSGDDVELASLDSGDASNSRTTRNSAADGQHLTVRNRSFWQALLARLPTNENDDKIDVVSRIAFPVVLALFNVVYWSAYSA
jgi:hypothetical protein